MKVADLFIGIGVKDNTKTKEVLTGVHNQLKDIFSSSLALKAGLLGGLVGLEEFTRRSVDTAMDLDSFSRATGLSSMELQKWGSIARVNNVSFEEMENAIKAVQNAQAAMRLGKGVPEWAAWFKLDPTKNPFQVFEQLHQKIQTVSKDEKELGTARLLASGVLGDKMFAMLSSGTRDVGWFKGLEMSTRETDKLVGLGREWIKLWETFRLDGAKVLSEFAIPLSEVLKEIRSTVHALAQFTIKGGFSETLDWFKRVLSTPSEGSDSFMGPKLPPEQQAAKDAIDMEKKRALFKGMAIPAPRGVPDFSRGTGETNPEAGAVQTGDTNVNITNTFHGDAGDQISHAEELNRRQLRSAIAQSPVVNQKPVAPKPKGAQ